MLRAKFQDHMTFGSGEEEGVYQIWVWWSSWSCDHDYFYEIYVPSSHGSFNNLALIDQVVSKTKMFENNSHIHVYSPGAGADNPWGSNLFQKCIFFC